jgi:hypothetical protein
MMFKYNFYNPKFIIIAYRLKFGSEIFEYGTVFS